jgi:hypothetical protein
VGAETSEAFVAEVGFHGVNATDQHENSKVELLLLNYQRVFDITL